MKTQFFTNWKKVSSLRVTEKELVTRIHYKSFQSNQNNTKNPKEKIWAKA